MNWESYQREQLKECYEKKMNIHWGWGTHISHRKLLRPAKLFRSEIKLAVLAHNSLFLVSSPLFHSIAVHSPGIPQVHSPMYQRQLICPIPHVPRSPSKKLISQLQIIIIVPPSFIACTPPFLPLFQSCSPSQNNCKEVKPGRPKLQILSWFAPDLHSRKKKKSLVPSSACDQRWA